MLHHQLFLFSVGKVGSQRTKDQYSQKLTCAFKVIYFVAFIII